MKILFCAGGTFGHVAPALAAADALKKKAPDTEILFAGRENGAENKTIRKAGYTLYEIPMQSIGRRLNIQTLRAALTTIQALGKAKNILRQIKPDIVFGTGGYVCYPILRAAQALGIPTALHESNATAGRACRMLAPKCRIVLLGTRGCEKSLPANTPWKFTGNPVREEFFLYTKEKARRILGLPSNARLIFSFGGSGGAQCLNDAILSFMAKRDIGQNIYHVHAVGKKYYEEAAARYPAFTARNSKNRIFPFIENMPLYMCAADLCICRSGAMTVAELAAAKLPAILVPSPNVTENHQHKNAQSLVDIGGAVLLEEKNLGRLGDAIAEILSDEARRTSMQESLMRCREKEAADQISASILSILP